MGMIDMHPSGSSREPVRGHDRPTVAATAPPREADPSQLVTSQRLRAPALADGADGDGVKHAA